MHERLPSLEELGTWALQHFPACPAITITTNEERQTFTATMPRDGVKLTFSFGYLYELQQRVKRRELAMAGLRG